LIPLIDALDGDAVWLWQAWKMSSSSWNSVLRQEGIEHDQPNDYLVSLTPTVFNYGAELQLPRVRLYIITISWTTAQLLYVYYKIRVTGCI